MTTSGTHKKRAEAKINAICDPEEYPGKFVRFEFRATVFLLFLPTIIATTENL